MAASFTRTKKGWKFAGRAGGGGAALLSAVVLCSCCCWGTSVVEGACVMMLGRDGGRGEGGDIACVGFGEKGLVGGGGSLPGVGEEVADMLGGIMLSRYLFDGGASVVLHHEMV